MGQIADLGRATAQEWDRTADASPAATFFHTREWAELWQSRSGGKLEPAALVARFDDGTRAVLPALRKSLLDLPAVGPFSPPRTVISSYGSTYGGWISAEPLKEHHHRALWERLNRFSVDLVQNPFDDAQQSAGLPWTREDFTQVVDLRDGYDAARRRFSRGHVSAINKATRNGVTVVEADRPEQWRAYLGTYRRTLERWDTPLVVHPDDLFHQLEASTSGRIRLWVAEFEGEVIAGAVCFHQARIVSYWHGAFDERFQHLRPAALVHAEVMRRAAEEGRDWYDFNPTGGIPGVVTFKERFGAERRPVHSLVRDAGVKRALGGARDVIRRAASSRGQDSRTPVSAAQ